MPASPPAFWRLLTRRARSYAGTARAAPRALVAAAAVCFLAELAAQLAFSPPFPGGADLLREGLLVASFVALWLAARPSFEHPPADPLQALGRPALAALGLFLVAALSRSLGLAAGVTGAGQVMLQHATVLAELAFVLFLLLQLRQLVLYRRTRTGQRNWNLMLFS